jgi:hypothetical protein
MVHFPTFALSCLCIQQEITSLQLVGFPHSEIYGSSGCLHLTVAYRSFATSFIASMRLGIHRMLLVA